MKATQLSLHQEVKTRLKALSRWLRLSIDHPESRHQGYPFIVSSQATLVPSSRSSNHIPPIMENVEDRLSRRRAPLVLPSLVLEGVTNTDVDVGEALLGGLTIAGTPTPTIMISSSGSIKLPLHHT